MPLSLVAEFLSSLILSGTGGRSLDVGRGGRVRGRIGGIVGSGSLASKMGFTVLHGVSSQFGCSYFMGVIRRVRLGLCPRSRQDMLFSLLDCTGGVRLGHLILAARDPCIVGCLALTTGTFLLARGVSTGRALRREVGRMIPTSDTVSPTQLQVCRLGSKKMFELDACRNLPSSRGFLGVRLKIAGRLFSRLLRVRRRFSCGGWIAVSVSFFVTGYRARGVISGRFNVYSSRSRRGGAPTCMSEGRPSG